VIYYGRYENVDYDQPPHGEIDYTLPSGEFGERHVREVYETFEEYHERHADPVEHLLIDVFDEDVDGDEAESEFPQWWFDIHEEEFELDDDEAVSAVWDRVQEDQSNDFDIDAALLEVLH